MTATIIVLNIIMNTITMDEDDEDEDDDNDDGKDSAAMEPFVEHPSQFYTTRGIFKAKPTQDGDLKKGPNRNNQQNVNPSAGRVSP